jgi:DNA ligase-associated metallophosphoesterase
VPSEVSQGNFSDLDKLINLTHPGKIILLGDLFHSRHNSEWEQFKQWRCKYEYIIFHLVLGNHDILKKEAYDECQLIIHPDDYVLKPFVFSHEPKLHSSSAYNLAGHIHPSVHVKGKGRQNLKFRCFYFGENYGLLPAFGNFTGTCVIEPLAGDSVFLILENKIVKM